MIGVLKFTLCNLTKTLIITAHHENIYIIIPRNESIVPRSTQQSPSASPPFEAVFLTHTRKFIYQIQLDSPYFFDFRPDVIAAAFLTIEEI